MKAMSIRSFPAELSRIVADYAPAEATYMIACFGRSENVVGLFRVNDFVESRHVFEFLVTFNRQAFLFINQAHGFSTKLTAQKNTKGPDAALLPFSGRIHFSTEFSDLLKGYRCVRALVHSLATGLNESFSAPDFLNERFGFGYLRPQVEFVPPFTVSNPLYDTTFFSSRELLHPNTRYSYTNRVLDAGEGDAVGDGTERIKALLGRFGRGVKNERVRIPTIVGLEVIYCVETAQETLGRPTVFGVDYKICLYGLYDWRLMEYAQQDNSATATAFGGLFIEAGVRATATMLENARKDGKNAVVELIEADNNRVVMNAKSSSGAAGSGGGIATAAAGTNAARFL